MSAILVLAGMLIEIFGALLLAIDAIGVARVNDWATGSTLLRRYLSRDESAKLGRLGLVAAVLIVLCAYAVGAYVVTKSDRLIATIGIMHGGLAFLIGLAVSMLTLEFFRLLLLGITTGLRSVSSMAEQRTAGIIGAGMLVLGFSMQFFGTVAQAIK